MKRVIIVNGTARSGKDTFVKYLDKSLDTHLFQLSSIGKVKKVTEEVLGIKPTKDDGYRKLLSDIKDALTEYNDWPFNHMIEKIDGHLNSFKSSIVTVMVREPDEIGKLLDHYGYEKACTVLITRDVAVPDNHADTDVEDYDYMHYIDNNGTLEEFREKVKEYARKTVNRGGAF